MKKTCIIIPCFNEVQNIATVIQDIKKHMEDADVIVINDCSTDRTAQEAKNAGADVVLDLPYNLGIGGTVQAGMIYAERNNYDFAVKFDGDGQHAAEDLDKLLAPVVANSADMSIGSRFCSKNAGFKSTFMRRLGIRIFCTLNYLLIGQKITDNTSGFRAYNRRTIKFLAKHYPAFDYPEPEEVTLLGHNKFKMCEVFSAMRPRQGGKSSIVPTVAVYYMVKVVLAILMVYIRPLEEE